MRHRQTEKSCKKRDCKVKISGLGIDIVENSKIRKVASKVFLNRAYSSKEFSLRLKSVNKYERLAAKFAAKKAVMKALVDKIIEPKDMGIVNEISGHLNVKIKGEKVKLFVNISHCKKYAYAVCMAA